MNFPPNPRTPYVLDNEQDERIFAKLARLKERELSSKDEELIKLLYSQLETDWRTPLEEFIDKLLAEK